MRDRESLSMSHVGGVLEEVCSHALMPVCMCLFTPSFAVATFDLLCVRACVFILIKISGTFDPSRPMQC